jgi:hypothetical protein
VAFNNTYSLTKSDMKKLFIVIAVFVLLISNWQCTQKKELIWKIADNPILTEWALKVDPVKPWPEYPRPDMTRKDWVCLNGLWDYAITPRDVKPEKWDGKILVPFPVESAMSGVKKRISDSSSLWYRTNFVVPGEWGKKRLILNFEASDWETKVWIDGKEAGVHKGGYDPFSFDISSLLNNRSKHELLVCVWDPSSKGTQPRGKQVTNPNGIWYTPTTGIWQTVWLEPVNSSHITSFRFVSDIDASTLSFIVKTSEPANSALVISVKDKDKTLAIANGKSSEELILKIENPVLWTPENPYLYDINIVLKEGNNVLDEVISVAGMRKISIGKSDGGFTRMLLNNKFIFQNGPLDQGFWPDGLYTPPTDEAMVYDLKMTKAMGFNMLRKHVKVENRRFYNWCDKLGILVWQDMPSGDASIRADAPDIKKDTLAAEQFRTELKNLIETKYNHPSIIMWVPFNEGWGQFQTENIVDLIRKYDPSRLVDNASGWTDRKVGDVMDVHNYPLPLCPPAEEKRAIVNGEFGGLGYPVKDHTWEKQNWGYRTFEDTVQLLNTYSTYYDMVYNFVSQKGLSAVIYTQTTDVETETNGLMTYDRKINKMGVANVALATTGITPPVLENPVHVFIGEFTAILKNHNKNAKIYFTLDGTEPGDKSELYKSPLRITKSCTLKTFALHERGSSITVTYNLVKKNLIEATSKGKSVKGLNVSIYEGQFSSLPDFSKLRPVKTTESMTVTPRFPDMNQKFALTFDGFIRIPADGLYGLFLNSDDGSKMIIDDKEVLLNDGVHTRAIEKGDFYALGKGFHKLHIEFFQETSRRPVLRFSVEVPGQPRKEVPADWLYK